MWGYLSRARRMDTASVKRDKSGLGIKLRDWIQVCVLSGLASPFKIRSLNIARDTAVPTTSNASSNGSLSPGGGKVHTSKNRVNFSKQT